MTGRNIDSALAHIDRMRKKLRDDFRRDMAKLDADERELLGLRPVAEIVGDGETPKATTWESDQGPRPFAHPVEQ